MNNSLIYLNALIESNNKITLEIYTKFYPKVEFFILQNSGKKKDAQDVFQDALMYLIIKHKEKPLQIQSFEAYLFTICKNIWRTSLKNKWVMKEDVVILSDKETDLSILILEQNRLELYQEKFQLLSDNCKEVLSNYFNGMTYNEIVKDLSYASINTVRQRVFKCKRKMIELIKSDKNYRNLI